MSFLTAPSYPDLAARLSALGFEPGCPGRVPGWALDADVAAARESACEHCGRRGLLCEPWRERAGRGYRCVALCPTCNSAFEF